MVKYRVTLRIHDTNLEGDRLDLTATIEVTFIDASNGKDNRAAALDSAERKFSTMGLSSLMENPDMRLYWDASLMTVNA